MAQEDKKLLLKDLCGRLPYGVKVELHNEVCTLLGYFDDFVMLTSNTPLGQQTNIANIKPYLRPMSSMTEEEKWEEQDTVMKFLQDFYNERHLDYRGLIEKGLALEAPEGMYA